MPTSVVAGVIIVAKCIGLARYAYLIRRGDINPATSTWLILTLATGISLATYAIAERADLRAGILNTIDVSLNLLTLVAVYAWNKSPVLFESFERWYVAGITLIIVYGLVTGRMWQSNILTQVLLVIAYLPTLHKLIRYERNTESYAVWGMAVFAGTVALYPALVGGNMLAVIYTLRSTVSCLLVMSLMFYYDWRQKNASANLLEL